MQRRIAWLNEHLLYWNGGIHYIYEASSRLGSVDVIVTKASEENIKRFQSAGTNVIQISLIAANNIWYWVLYPFFLCVNAYKLSKLLKSYQVVISTSPTTNIMCWMIGVRPIIMVFEVNPWLYDEQYVQGLSFVQRTIVKVAGSFMRIWDKKAHRNAKVLFCWSDMVRRNVMKVYGEDVRAEVNYGGVESSEFYKQGSSRRNLILHIASYLSPVKGTEYLVRAMKYLKNAELFIINSHEDERERNRLRAIAKDLDVYIKFFSKVESLSPIYSMASVLAQPSLDFNVHYPVVEAAFCECPSVSFKGRYPNEDIIDGETGILVSVGIQSLAQGLGSLLADSRKRDLMGLQAKKFAMERFSWDKHIEKYRRVIDEFRDGKN